MTKATREAPRDGGTATGAQIVYRQGSALYVNLTSRCRLRCTFCFKELMGDYPGHRLVMPRRDEPGPEEVIRLVERSAPFDELVFCGLGEPLERLDAVISIARRVRAMGHPIRVNTDGLLYLKGSREDLERLAPLVDRLSVSLNAPDTDTYVRLCRPPQPSRAFGRLLQFIRDARTLIPEVRVTVVDLPGLDLAACRRLVADLGVPLVVRPYLPGPGSGPGKRRRRDAI